MRKDTVHYQVWKPECLQDLLPVFRQDAQPVHPRVQGQMDMDTPPSGCQGPPVVNIRHRLGQMPSAVTAPP